MCGGYVGCGRRRSYLRVSFFRGRRRAYHPGLGHLRRGDLLEASDGVLVSERPEKPERLDLIHKAGLHHLHGVRASALELLRAQRDLAIEHGIPALRKLRTHGPIVERGRHSDQPLVRVTLLQDVFPLCGALPVLAQTDRIPALRAAARALKVGWCEARVSREPVRDRSDRRLDLLDIGARLELPHLRLLLHRRVEHEDRRRVSHDLDALTTAPTVDHIRPGDANTNRVPLGERGVPQGVREEAVVDREVETALVELHAVEGVEEPVAVQARVVQHDRQDRGAVRAPVRVRLARVRPAEHLKGHVLAHARVLRQTHRVGRRRWVANVQDIVGPLRFASDVPKPDFGVGQRRRRPARVGLGDRHIGGHRAVDQSAVLDIDPHPHLAERDHHRLKPRHLRPEPGASDQTIRPAELVHRPAGRVVGNVRGGVVQGGELGRHDLERVAADVGDAPRLTARAAELRL